MPGRERVITPEPPLAAPTTSSQHVHEVRPAQRSRVVDLIPLPKCRMIRHNSRRAAFNRFPLRGAGNGLQDAI
jgi:hypothetical protein